MERHKLDRSDLQLLARGQVLTTEELAKVLRTSRDRAAKLAFDLKRRGFLTSVRRGLYASVPLDADPQRFQPDPFLAVSRALGDYYAFSHFSALALLGGESTVRKTVDVTGPNARARNKALGGFRVHVHHMSPRVWNHSTKQLRRAGKTLRVTTPERTLIDLAALPNSQQDYEAEVQAFQTLLPRADLSKLLDEVLSLTSKTTRARVGHLLLASSKGNREVSHVLNSIQESLRSTSTSYLGTRPNDPSNRFDSRFGIVYPGNT